jgi:hypothetical protein
MLGRFKKLQHELVQGLKQLPKGKLSYRREREYVLQALIEDLQKLNMLVPQLLGLVERPERLKKLIAFWEKKGNCIKTIRLKLAILRQVYKINYPQPYFSAFPSYASLNLPTPKPVSLSISQDHPLDQIVDEELRQRCTLQQLFGLKKIEALRFTTGMITATQLQLPRRATYNRRDRNVPIITPEQAAHLANLSSLERYKKEPSLAEIKSLTHLYQHYFKRYGLGDHEHYRYQYIKARYQALRLKGESALVATQQLSLEVGYKQVCRTREVLKCLNVF